MGTHSLRSFDRNGARYGSKYDENNYQLPKSDTISNWFRHHAHIIRDTCPKNALPIAVNGVDFKLTHYPAVSHVASNDFGMVPLQGWGPTSEEAE
jgi:hypothetical protein